jgi:hypothetical protein
MIMAPDGMCAVRVLRGGLKTFAPVRARESRLFVWRLARNVLLFDFESPSRRNCNDVAVGVFALSFICDGWYVDG